jgi:hypothetical protein
VAVLCIFNATTVEAAEYEYLIEATALAEHTNNSRRDSLIDEEELLFQQRLRGNLTRATSKLVTNIDYVRTKNNYRKNLLSDRTYVTGASSIDWIIAPERFSWNLSNTRSFQVEDSLLPDTIDNRQVVSLTSTGPSATIKLSGRDRLVGSVEYSIADDENVFSPRQDRITTDAVLSHNFSTNYTSSIGGNYLQSKIDDAPILDFDRYEYFWQNQYGTGVFDFNLMLGQNGLVRDNFEDQESFLVRFSGNYKINSRSSFGFNYSDSFADIFSNILSFPETTAPDQFIEDRLGSSNLSQNYKSIQKGITYNYVRSESFGMNIGYSEAERIYDDVFAIAQNQFDKIFSIGVNWKFFENIDFSLYGRYSEQDFPDINREQERKEYGMTLAYRISKSFSTQFTLQSTDQIGNFEQDQYDAVNYSLSITYALGN